LGLWIGVGVGVGYVLISAIDAHFRFKVVVGFEELVFVFLSLMWGLMGDDSAVVFCTKLLFSMAGLRRLLFGLRRWSWGI
jgi:hypothetical protein